MAGSKTKRIINSGLPSLGKQDHHEQEKQLDSSTDASVATPDQTTKGKRKRADTVPEVPVSHQSNIDVQVDEAQKGETEQANSNSDVTSSNNPKQPAKKPKTKKQQQKKQQQRKPSSPWPDPFKKLSRTHRALNLVYTFCCTRKHFATTFDNIKKAVQAQSGTELTIEDIARVKVLRP